MSLLPFTSKLIADVGITMGDEGKGRLIPEVTEELRASTGQESPVFMVLKVNGGANSGHTAGGVKLNLLPAGVIESSIPYLGIGSGVVADPRKFMWEAKPLEKAGFKIINQLAIDERTMVADLSHRLLDLAWEDYRVNILKNDPRGSTGRGITPAYQDETGQWQITYVDFLGDRETFAQKMIQRADRALRTIEHVCQVSAETWDSFFDTLTTAETRANQEAIDAGIFPAEEFDFQQFRTEKPFTLNTDRLVEVYWNAGQAFASQVTDIRELVLQALSEDRSVIGEFGQAYWLDKRHGFSPNVTAAHTFTPEFFQSANIPCQPIHTIGVAKAYDTKVGTHIFLTQIEEGHALSDALKKLEFGTSTGRQRMVGWFDAIEKADALRYGGYQDLMINKIDALGKIPGWDGNLLICTAYKDPEGKITYHVPRQDSVRKELSPVYKIYPSWEEDISSVRHFDDLPDNAKAYVGGMVKSILDAAYHGETWPKQLPNLRYIGVGPNPSQIIKDVPSTEELIKFA
ncbi:MAG: adenylosuccinate synthetase [Opitutaceae bacterium]|nr:adenylosuccinate synthetase [Opitutaceae bacterium]